MSTIVRHFEVAHKDAVGDGVLPEVPAEVLYMAVAYSYKYVKCKPHT